MHKLERIGYALVYFFSANKSCEVKQPHQSRDTDSVMRDWFPGAGAAVKFRTAFRGSPSSSLWHSPLVPFRGPSLGFPVRKRIIFMVSPVSFSSVVIPSRFNILWINHSPVDESWRNQLRYPMGIDLSGG